MADCDYWQVIKIETPNIKELKVYAIYYQHKSYLPEGFIGYAAGRTREEAIETAKKLYPSYYGPGERPGEDDFGRDRKYRALEVELKGFDVVAKRKNESSRLG